MLKVVKQLLILLFAIIICGCHDNSVSTDSVIPTRNITFFGAKAKGRAWVQKEFVISTFNGLPQVQYLEQGVKTLKEAGFNWVETAWRKSNETKAILAECDKQGGLKVIAQDMSTLGGFAWFIIHPFSEDSVSVFLNRFGHYKSLAGVYVYDEPKEEEFDIVKNNINLFESLRPDLLGFSVLLQSYSPWYKWDEPQYIGFDKYVDKYMDKVAPAVLSTDYYPIYTHTTNESFAKDNFWRDLSYMRKKALKNDAIFWFYYQSVEKDHPDLAQGSLTSAQITVQAWAAILYGAKGLQSFCASNGVVDSLGKKGTLFNDIQHLNRKIASIGNILLALQSTAVYHGDPFVNDPLANTIENSIIASIPMDLSVAEFKDMEGNVYILLLNRNFVKAHKDVIHLRFSYRLYDCMAEDGGVPTISNSIEFNLQAGDAALYRLQNVDQKPEFLRYTVIK